jgi:hypothetical protein
MKRRHCIDMTVAIGQAGNGIGAMVVIAILLLSSAATGFEHHKRIFFQQSAICRWKKDFLSTFTERGDEGCRLPPPTRKPKCPPLAEPACRCSYPN